MMTYSTSFLFFLLSALISSKAQDSCVREGDLRLEGGYAQFEGRLEMCTNRSGDMAWRVVCQGSYGLLFGTNEAAVACRQLQSQSNWNYSTISDAIVRRDIYFSQPLIPCVALESTFVCHGDESRLDQCRHGSTESYRRCYCSYVGLTCVPSDRSVIPACPPSRGLTTCANGLCLIPTSGYLRVNFKFICNKLDDCGDCSDECHCSYIVDRYDDVDRRCRGIRTVNICNCRESEFHCWNGFCIPYYEMCDGYNQCGDWSDELNDECAQRTQSGLGISLGVGLGLPLLIIVVLCLVALMLCMFIPGCPLRKLYRSERQLTSRNHPQGKDPGDPHSKELLLSEPEQQTE